MKLRKILKYFSENLLKENILVCLKKFGKFKNLNLQIENYVDIFLKLRNKIEYKNFIHH